MPEFNLIKNFYLTLKFGGDRKIEVASGENSEGALVLSSQLGMRAVDFSKKSDRQSLRVKSLQKPKNKRK